MAAKRQMRIPGTEAQKIKELDHAAEAYVEARDSRMAHTEKEVEARDALIAVMKKHDLQVYKDEDHDPPLIITLSPGKDSIKVQQAKDFDDAGGDE